MKIAIDETGDFSPKSNHYHFLSAVHLQSRDNNIELIFDRFNHWENSLPRTLKNHKGEIKSSSLSIDQLDDFIEQVVIPQPRIAITTIRFNPRQNPYQIVNKHKQMQQFGINEGVILFNKLNRPRIAKTVLDFSYWFRKLSYTQFIKIELLGMIIYKSLKNTMGISLAWGMDNEILDIQFIIDEMFLKGQQQNTFWHEILRNQIYSESVKEPLPFLIDWEDTGHPFIDKYVNEEGILDFNDLFWNNCKFEKSHTSYEIRIADTVNTILSKHYNYNHRFKNSKKFFQSIVPKRGISHIVLNDFDIEKAIGKVPFNPWENKEQFKLRMKKLSEVT